MIYQLIHIIIHRQFPVKCEAVCTVVLYRIGGPALVRYFNIYVEVILKLNSKTRVKAEGRYVAGNTETDTCYYELGQELPTLHQTVASVDR
jgi:hypothetical protein